MYRSNLKRMLSIGVCLGCMLFGVMTFAQEQKGKTILMGVQKDIVVTLDEVKDSYVLSGEYVVPKGFELKIKEGVKLVANKKSSIVIQGTLDIQGTKEDPVVIRASGSGFGAWDGIKLMQCSGEISHAHISGAKEAIFCQHSNLRVWNSTFYRNERVLRTHEGYNVQFENCYFAENKCVFDAHMCKLELDHCSIVRTKEAIMPGSWGGKTICRDCIVEKNRLGFCGASSIEMHGCVIQDNGKFDIKNDSSSSGDCTGNWWGKRKTELLKKNGGTKLPQVIGNVVNLSDFLLERPEGCGAQDYPKETLK